MIGDPRTGSPVEDDRIEISFIGAKLLRPHQYSMIFFFFEKEDILTFIES